MGTNQNFTTLMIHLFSNSLIKSFVQMKNYIVTLLKEYVDENQNNFENLVNFENE